MKQGLMLIALLLGAGASSFAQSPSPAASPSVAASPLATWAKLPPVPEEPKPTEAEKKGLEITIFYTSNLLGEIDPCG